MSMFAALSALLAACGRSPAAGEAPLLGAALAGGGPGVVVGSGSFQLAPPGGPGPVRFGLHSRGSGASAGEGFWFHSTRPPAAGERPLGVLNADTDRATYWRDQGSVRRIYAAESGSLRVERATGRRVTGSFRMQARLAYVCQIIPASPAPVVECEPTAESGSVEITGSFDAGPMGGDTPGLTPFPG